MQQTSRNSAPTSHAHFSPPPRSLNNTATAHNTAANRPSAKRKVKIAGAISPSLGQALGHVPYRNGVQPKRETQLQRHRQRDNRAGHSDVVRAKASRGINHAHDLKQFAQYLPQHRAGEVPEQLGLKQPPVRLAPAGLRVGQNWCEKANCTIPQSRAR